MKKQVERDAVHELRDREFVRMSLKNGAIGIPWLKKWQDDVYPKDRVIVDGAASRPPRRYDKWLQENEPDIFAKIKRQRMATREERSWERYGWYDPKFPDAADPDATDGRLGVIEECMIAKVNLFAREMDYA